MKSLPSGAPSWSRADAPEKVFEVCLWQLSDPEELGAPRVRPMVIRAAGDAEPVTGQRDVRALCYPQDQPNISYRPIARPVSLTKGTDPLAGAQPSILVILSGALKIGREGEQPQDGGAGDVIGMYETLAATPFPVRAQVVTEGRGLRFAGSDLLDLLADDIGLLRGIFGRFEK